MNSSEFISEVQRCLGLVEHTGLPFTFQCPVYLLGNGGSAAVASHICNDIIKNIGAAYVPDYATLACLANDLGWERALDYWLFQTRDEGTVVVISSSGKSENLINACTQAKCRSNKLVTFTGFDPENPIRSMGVTNYYVPSKNYGVVETCHLAILHSLINP